MNDTIKLLFGGDICLDNQVDLFCKQNKYDFIDSFKNEIPQHDLFVANLECPITNNVDPIIKTGPNLISSKDSIGLIKQLGIHVVTLANNHILDQNERGLIDTMKICTDNNIEYIGAGSNNIEAAKILYKEISNLKFSIINVAEEEYSIASRTRAGANSFELIDTLKLVEEAKLNSDFVILIFHGGKEFYPLPSPELKKKIHFLCDQGINLVIGHHTHVIGGYEIYNRVPIFYSLGNFIFDRENITDKDWYEGALLDIELSTEGEIIKWNFLPFKQFFNEPILKVYDKDKKREFDKKIEEYSIIISDDNKLNYHFAKLIKKERYNYLDYILRSNRYVRYLIRKGFLNRLFLKDILLKSILNMLRCDAHRELLTEVLKDELKKRNFKL